MSWVLAVWIFGAALFTWMAFHMIGPSARHRRLTSIFVGVPWPIWLAIALVFAALDLIEWFLRPVSRRWPRPTKVPEGRQPVLPPEKPKR